MGNSSQIVFSQRWAIRNCSTHRTHSTGWNLYHFKEKRTFSKSEWANTRRQVSWQLPPAKKKAGALLWTWTFSAILGMKVSCLAVRVRTCVGDLHANARLKMTH